MDTIKTWTGLPVRELIRMKEINGETMHDMRVGDWIPQGEGHS